MSDVVIRVDNLGKQYCYGRQPASETLRDRLTGMSRAALKAISGPFRKAAQPSANGDGKAGDLFWALKDVSFEVKRGEVVGIIGRNGAGKSTLLKILSRITEPTTGYAEIDGQVASLLEVGTGFHPELTGRENVFLNGAILGMSHAEIRRKFDEIVAFAEVERFIDTAVKHYSSGMYLRLAFAVAAHLDPEILIIDEVLAVGDEAFQKKCFGKVDDIAKHGRTVLVVSHNMPMVINLCHRAILVKSGKAIADGRPAEVVEHYLAAGRTSSGEVVWQDPSRAPGNDTVRLHAVRVFQEGFEGPTADIDIAKDVRVQISYWNFREGERLYAALWLKHQLGTPVLSSGTHKGVSQSEDLWYGRPHPVGLFRSECVFPANFLNEGRYTITPIVGKGIATTLLLEEDLIGFDVHDSGSMRQEYFGGWLGTVRPKLPWQTEYLGKIASPFSTSQQILN